jgi:hypothetical protein
VRSTCAICQSPSSGADLCDGCRVRLSMPLVDPDAAAELAERYRAQRAGERGAQSADPPPEPPAPDASGAHVIPSPPAGGAT